MPLKAILITSLQFSSVFIRDVASGNIGVFIFLSVLLAAFLLLQHLKNRYFNSEEFQNLRGATKNLIDDHNAIVKYVAEMRSQNAFQLGFSRSGEYACYASFANKSVWNYRRDKHIPEYAPLVQQASLAVVRRASEEPIKYLMKYFSIKADIDTLAHVQRVSENISRLEEAIANLQEREHAIVSKMNPPDVIRYCYMREFWNRLGIQLSPIAVPYAVYKFQYISAGGNSSQETEIVLTTPVLDALSEELGQKIKWKQSATSQRALVTSHLRQKIKQRDNYTCQTCGLSIDKEPNLLLEIDHIIPVSKGGLSTLDNLQTLCWKCNRSKGNKIL